MSTILILKEKLKLNLNCNTVDVVYCDHLRTMNYLQQLVI